MKTVSEPRKNLSSFFPQIKFIVFKRERLKNGLLSYSATFFFPQIYTAKQILIRFVYCLIPVGFIAILMSFLSFLCQKTYPGEFLKSEIISSRSCLRKYSIWLPTYHINLSFFKNAKKLLTAWSQRLIFPGFSCLSDPYHV